MINGLDDLDVLQYRFVDNTKITMTGPSFTTHNSVYIESGSTYRQKFSIYSYTSTDDVTGFLKDS